MYINEDCSDTICVLHLSTAQEVPYLLLSQMKLAARMRVVFQLRVSSNL